MKKTFSKSTISTALALTLTACGGGSIDVAGGGSGIGGTGFTSGTVTGFGSVFVNGVEFETDSAVFNIDGSNGSQSDLAIGMVVTVDGTVNADGVTGNATSISFDDQLQGPVSGLTAPDPDGDNRSFTVLGTTVRINSLDTVYDVTGILNGTAFGFGSIADGNHIEVSGFFNDAGELVATRVELKAITFVNSSSIIELKGIVAGFTSVSAPFTLEGLSSINIDASGANFDDLPSGLSNGISVEVKGTCADSSCSTLNATRVEARNGFANADKISVEGIITDFVDISNFKINGIGVDATNATLIPTTLGLKNGVRIEAEGPINNNVIKAKEVKLRGGTVKVHATISSVDSTTGHFVVTANSATLATIAVTVDTTTQTDGSITAGNFVRIRGFENESGGVTATRVEVRGDDDVIVQGNLQSFSADNSVQILGVAFDVNYNSGSGETDFSIEDVNGNESGITQAAFITQAPTGTLVKVKDKNDKNVLGVADEIEIENP